MKLLFIVLLAALMFTSSSVMAADVDAGKAKSVVCASCHGPAGISSNPMWPNLAGQQEMYLVKQIKAFRDGDRKDPMMAPMVAALSDDDIANLAAYYAAQK
jgi:cytochrome c553